LVNLTIRRYRIIRPDVLVQLANLPISLEHLRIESCLIDLRINAEILLRQLLLNIFARCSHLRTFSIVGRGSCYGYLVIDGELLTALPQSMEHLFISAGDSLKLDNLHFLRRLPHLQTLSAQRSYIGDEDLALLADCCPNLEHLDLSHSRRIFSYHNIAQCDRLRQLIVDGNRDYFSDHHLRAIVRGCPLLEELSVETCAQLTELGLVEIGRCRRLKKLSLWGLGCVTDTVMLAIASGCTLIEYLDLKYCRKITSLGLSGLLRLTELRTLFVSGIEDFDREMSERLRVSTKLEKLEANDCRLSKCLDWERQARMIKQMAETALPIARLDS